MELGPQSLSDEGRAIPFPPHKTTKELRCWARRVFRFVCACRFFEEHQPTVTEIMGLLPEVYEDVWKDAELPTVLAYLGVM